MTKMSHIVGNSMRRSILRKHLLSICLLANINNNTLSKHFIGSAPTLEELKWKLLSLKASRKMPTSSPVVATKQKIKV
jgi:hypothetical protein